MAQKLRPFYSPHLTRAGEALAKRLREHNAPIVTPYEIFAELREVYKHGRNQGLYLRSTNPNLSDYQRIRRNLIENNIVASDSNYHHAAYRILDKSDLPADDICCIVDPFCYISHLSAMQRYGLTNRRPEALHLSRPGQRIIRNLVQKRMRADYGTILPGKNDCVPLRVVTHPPVVRRRKVYLYQTVHPGKSIQVRSSFARISTIGQTFVDMIEEPSLCGGMDHVLEVWKEHAGTYIDELISSVSEIESKIIKVRAGYILEVLLNIEDHRITKWAKFAQRGGSRRLDPSKPYVSKFSEKWMISVNV